MLLTARAERGPQWDIGTHFNRSCVAGLLQRFKWVEWRVAAVAVSSYVVGGGGVGAGAWRNMSRGLI